MDVRLDKWLWAVRVYKSRSDAAEACRTGRVWVNDTPAKPSRELRQGDLVAVRKMAVTYGYRVVELVSSRQPAKDVARYATDVTPQEELDKLNAPRESVFIRRERGAGRPTKKERREIDLLMEGITERNR
jgi:ribosome-associated heat shock protein Hsp15